MIQPQFVPDSRSRSARVLPLGATVDLLGLVMFSMIVVWMINVPEAEIFLFTLVTTGVLAWLVIGQIRTSWGSIFRRGYRYLLAPSVAAVCTLVVSAGLREYYSGVALLTFVTGWTLWIALGRYAAMRYSPRVRLLWIGGMPQDWDADDVPGLDIEAALRPPQRWGGWDTVVADPKAFESDAWRTWLLHAELANVDIVSSHKAREILTGRVPLDAMREDLLPIAFHPRTSYTSTKRFFDVLAVIALSPLILVTSLIVALVVWFDNGRPILYTQQRVGRNGESFRIFKFRTMKKDAEAEGPSFTTNGDRRVTSIGSFLRKFRLDELPQFWNVLRGEMSIIGPRPEQVPFVEEFVKVIPMYDYRHLVRPGITGWAQVTHGYAAGTNETRDKLSYDLYYVKHQSLLLDLIIVFKTIRTILSGFGAR